MAGFEFSKTEPFAGIPSEQRLLWRATFFPDKQRDGTASFAVTEESRGPPSAAADKLRVYFAGTSRQAHRALMRNSVLDFTMFVKGKSGPPGEESGGCGLFINPIGELESMLKEYGIPATTDKKGWITLALQLVPNLESDETKYPWKFVKLVHDQKNLV